MEESDCSGGNTSTSFGIFYDSNDGQGRSGRFDVWDARLDSSGIATDVSGGEGRPAEETGNYSRTLPGEFDEQLVLP